MCLEKGHGNVGARQAGRRQGDDDGQAADDLHHILIAPDQFSRRVLQLLAALPRRIDRKEPRPTPKAHNRDCGRGGGRRTFPSRFGHVGFGSNGDRT